MVQLSVMQGYFSLRSRSYGLYKLSAETTSFGMGRVIWRYLKVELTLIPIVRSIDLQLIGFARSALYRLRHTILIRYGHPFWFDGRILYTVGAKAAVEAAEKDTGVC